MAGPEASSWGAVLGVVAGMLSTFLLPGGAKLPDAWESPRGP
jgi:hypothetical protein